MRVLKRIKGKWYVYEVTTKYLGPVEEVGTEEEKRRIMLNPTFFERGKFLYSKELESLVKRLLIAERVEVEGIYIYGSQVRGIYGAKSDLDVWVRVKPRDEKERGLYSGPTLLTATRRMDAPLKGVQKFRLAGAEVEICRSTFNPNPPYFDIRKQRLVG